MIRRVLAAVAGRWHRLALDHFARGDSLKALSYCIKCLSTGHRTDPISDLMARIVMPGEDYFHVLSRFHEWLKPETYVEIGVAHGDSLMLARPETRAIGIDPYPQIRTSIQSRATLYPVPSDKFFADHDLLRELDAKRLALCFIDGLHHFEQVLNDFINVERYSDAHTVVLIHDYLPVTRQVATRVRATDFWCGDVWKIVFCLAEHRPDLTLSVLPVYPSGLLLVTGLNPRSSVLRDRFQGIVEEYQDRALPYDNLDPAVLQKVWPNLVPCDREHVDRILLFVGSSR